MNINKVTEANLCISCGLCSSVCPHKCISFEETGIEYKPVINKDCTNCGICLNVCPLKSLNDYDINTSLENYIIGEYKTILCVNAKDTVSLEKSTSGSFITTTVKELLKTKMYDTVFLVEGYCYDTQLKTVGKNISDDFASTPKSRYLMISHCNTANYMKANPDKKVIIIATGCVVSGLLNFIKMNQLNRNNYLFIGLFCDKTMNYNVNNYFKQHPISRNKSLKSFHFRNKLSGGAPGGMRLFYTDGTVKDLSRKERMKIKDYFVPERCLYCLNKLNKDADISAGDNYIRKNTSGCNSIIIRTKKGADAFKQVSYLFIFSNDTKEEIIISQKLKDRYRNLAFSQIKGILPGYPDKSYNKLYKDALNKIELGKKENIYNTICFDLKKRKIIREITRPFKRLLWWAKPRDLIKTFIRKIFLNRTKHDIELYSDKIDFICPQTRAAVERDRERE